MHKKSSFEAVPLYVFLAALGPGVLLAIAAGSVPGATLFGVSLGLLGQLLLAVAFAAIALHSARAGFRWRSRGYALVAWVWVLAAGGQRTAALLGSDPVLVMMGLLVLGGAFLVLGLAVDIPRPSIPGSEESTVDLPQRPLGR